MALITWNESLSVKIEKIDKQHHQLVDLINNLHDAMKKGKSKDILSKILEDLVDYTVVHFSTEEELLEKNNFPTLLNHKNEHILFVKKVSDFQKEFKSSQLGLSIEIMDFLSDWLQKHINGTDKKYTEFLNKKGIH